MHCALSEHTAEKRYVTCEPKRAYASWASSTTATTCPKAGALALSTVGFPLRHSFNTYLNMHLKPEEKSPYPGGGTSQISCAFHHLVPYFLIQERVLLPQLHTDFKHSNSRACPLLARLSAKLQFSIPTSLGNIFSGEAPLCFPHANKDVRTPPRYARVAKKRRSCCHSLLKSSYTAVTWMKMPACLVRIIKLMNNDTSSVIAISFTQEIWQYSEVIMHYF